MSQMLYLGIFSSKAVLTVLLVAAAGTFLVRLKFLEDESLRVLSQCVFAIMLPCLLFSKVAEKVDFAALKQYWAIPVSCVLFVTAGLLLGLIAAKLLKYPDYFFGAGIAASSFGNISFIPIPLIAAVAMVFPSFASDSGASAQGIFYVSLYLMVYSPMLWSIGFHLISAKNTKKMGGSRLIEIINPPLVGMFLGIVVGTTPFLKGRFVGNDVILGPVFNAAGIVGAAAVPCALITLGGKLAYGPTHCSLPLRTILGISVIKMLLLPLFALLCVTVAMRNGLLPRDPLLALVLVIEAAVPQATNLSIICALRNWAIEKDMACVLFWNYIAAAPVLALFIIATMWLLG